MGAAEDDIFHFRASKGFNLLLSQNPTYGICDIALSAAIGTDNTGESLGQVQSRSVRERLEPLQFNFLKVHAVTSRLGCPSDRSWLTRLNRP